MPLLGRNFNIARTVESQCRNYDEPNFLASELRNIKRSKMKTCLLINSDPKDHNLYIEAIDHVAPDTCFILAIDSREAIEILSDDSLAPDYVIVEFMMPGIDALEFLRKARDQDVLAGIPVIVHSPFPVRHRMKDLLNMGAHALYFKPYSYVGICNMLSLFLKCFSVTYN